MKLLFLLSIIFANLKVLNDGVSFNYSKQGVDWGKSYSACELPYQSPIDIVENTTLDKDPNNSKINVDFTNLTLDTNRGALHTNFTSKGNFATLKLTKENKTVTYEMLQFHIHAPSEHLLNGKQFDAEIHMVFKVLDSESSKATFTESIEGQNVQRNQTLTVLGFFLDASMNQQNEFLDQWKILGENNDKVKLSFDYFHKLKESKKVNAYYNYAGSLTTPTCDEIVNWIVFKDPLPMNQDQKIQLLSRIERELEFSGTKGTYRAAQNLNGRPVYIKKLETSFVLKFLVPLLVFLFFYGFQFNL